MHASWIIFKSEEMNPSILLALPESIATDLLNDWLKVADVGRLDSAYCFRNARSQFLTLLSAYRVKFDRMNMTISAYRVFIDNVVNMRNNKENHILVWAMNRSLKVLGFTISSKPTGLMAYEELQDAFFARNGPFIRWIALRDCDDEMRMGSTIAKAVQNCPNTETLYLESSGLPAVLYDMYYPQLTQAFQSLQTLHVYYSKISSHGLKNLLQHCAMLKTLNMRCLAAPLPLEVALSSLEQFSALGCIVSEDVMYAIAANCPRMRHLHIFWRSFTVTEGAIHAILQGCPRLHYTDVEYAQSNISNELRLELARRRSFTELHFDLNGSLWKGATPDLCESVLRVSPNLLKLTVGSRSWLTDDFLAVCAEHCRGLESLHLSFCSAVTVTGILAITGPGNKLKTFILSGCIELGDEAVLAIAQRCPHLKEFHCPPQVSNGAIVALTKSCPQLENLQLNWNRKNGSIVATLAQLRPQLKVW